MSDRTRRLSLAVGLLILVWAAIGTPNPGIRLTRWSAPPEFIAFGLWVIVDTRLPYLCELKRQRWPQAQRIGYTALYTLARCGW